MADSDSSLKSNTIILEDTASTNFPARKIVLERDGEVCITSCDSSSGNCDTQLASNQHKIDAAIASRIFSGLEKIWPLQAGTQGRFKSISFGHCSYLTYKGQRSPDLDSCMSIPGVEALVCDLNILRQLEPTKQR